VLKSIAIRWFRGIKEAVIGGLSEVNVFIGRNGAGKSTLLEAIYLTSSWANPSDKLRGMLKLDYIVFRRGGRGDWSNTRDSLWYSMETGKEIGVDIVFDSGKKLEFRVPYFVSDSNYAVGLAPSEEIVKGAIPPNYIWSPEYRYNLYRDLILNTRANTIIPAPQALRDKVLEFLRDEVKFLGGVIFIDVRLLSEPKRVEEGVWPKLLARRLDKLIVKLVKSEYEPDAEDLTYMPFAGSYMLAVKLSRTTVPIDTLGDGARMAVLTSSIASIVENTALLLEDPEVHQHPRGMATLMRFLLSAAKKRRLQLFITTHSIELVNIVRKICDEEGLELCLFFMERGSNGVVDVRAMESLDVGTLLKLGIDPRFLEVM